MSPEFESMPERQPSRFVNRTLEFITAGQVLTIDLNPEGGYYEALRNLTLDDAPEAVVLHNLGAQKWKVFKPRVFENRLKEFQELPQEDKTDEYSTDLFEILGKSVTPTVRAGESITQPSIELTHDGKLKGVWLPPVGDTGSTMRGGEATAPDFTEEGPLRRTPHMHLPTEDPIQGTTFDVEIFADTQAPEGDEDSEPIEISETGDTFTLSVWLICSSELEHASDSTGKIVIVRNEERSNTTVFQLTVKAGALPGSVAKLTAAFSYNGRPCGRVSRSLTIGGATPPPSDPPEPPTGNDLPTPDRIQIENGLPRPSDLTIVIVRPDPGNDRFQVKVSTPHIPEFREGITGEWRLPADTGSYVKQIFAKFTAAPTTPDPETNRTMRLDNLLGAGALFYRSSPLHFRTIFQRLVAEGHPVETIYVVSEEPHIPWELMIPDFDHPAGRHWLPLGAEFAMGRWVHPGFQSPPVEAIASSASVLCPDYTGSLQKVLVNAAPEAKSVINRFGGSHLTPANYLGVRGTIATVDAPLFHFVGHGTIENADEVLCLERNEMLSSLQASGMPEFKAYLKSIRPVVFLNACEVGRQVPTLIGAGGFPLTFALGGAVAIIAPLWSVRDNTAHEVADQLYNAILSDWTTSTSRSIPQILREIRQRAYQGAQKGEDSFAAYCFYGDPSFFLRAPSVRAPSVRMDDAT